MLGRRRRKGENTDSGQQSPPQKAKRARQKRRRPAESSDTWHVSGSVIPDSQGCLDSDVVPPGSNPTPPSFDISSLRSLSPTGVVIENSTVRGNQPLEIFPSSNRHATVFNLNTPEFGFESESGPDSRHKAREKDSGNMSFAKRLSKHVERRLETNISTQGDTMVRIERSKAELTRLKGEEISIRQVLGKLEELSF